MRKVSPKGWVKIRYLGHSGFWVRIKAGGSFVIDPWLSKFRDLLPFAIGDITPVDLLLITHDDKDHCDPYSVNEIVKNTGARVVAPQRSLERLGLEERLVTIGDSVKGVRIKVVKADHGFGRDPNCVGYVFTTEDGLTLYHAGDGDPKDPSLRSRKTDILMIKIQSGIYPLNLHDVIEAVRVISPKIAIPMHYYGPSVKKNDPRKFEAEVSKLGQTCAMVFDLGQEKIIEV